LIPEIPKLSVIVPICEATESSADDNHEVVSKRAFCRSSDWNTFHTHRSSSTTANGITFFWHSPTKNCEWPSSKQLYLTQNNFNGAHKWKSPEQQSGSEVAARNFLPGIRSFLPRACHELFSVLRSCFNAKTQRFRRGTLRLIKFSLRNSAGLSASVSK